MAKFDFLEHIWGQLGRMWEVFGAHCISPGDASTGNFIITPAAKVVVIDGDGIHFHKSPQVARRHLRKAWRYLSQFAFLDAMSIEESLQAASQPDARPLAA